MSIFPNWGMPPAESTVEQDANHLLLQLLPSPAWFFVPTRREEKHLAYDASLQGFKACVLQYKRARILKRGGISIQISPNQLATLVKKFGPGAKPYVFVGASEYPTYRSLGLAVRTQHPAVRAYHIQYVAAHALPTRTTTIRITRSHPTASAIARPYINGSPYGKPVDCLSGIALINHLISCDVEHRVDSVAEFTREVRERRSEGRTSILLCRPRLICYIMRVKIDIYWIVLH